MNVTLHDDFDSLVDDRVRGIPPGSPPLSLREIAAVGWRPAGGDMALPVLTLDEAALAHNRAVMFDYARSHGVAIAPHAKTPMSPRIVQGLLDAGAWGITVANLQQAAVMLRAGVKRLLLANEIGGKAAGLQLGRLLAAYPDADLTAFADAPTAVETLAAAAERAGRAIPVLVEVGTGRGGARNLAAVEAVIGAVRASGPHLVLDGVATYEGAAAVKDPGETRAAIAALMRLTTEAFALIRALEPTRPLLLSAGGSSFFDEVVTALEPVTDADGRATLLLRSGAIFFHDHGVYERALAAMDERGGFTIDGRVASATESFQPALRLWAEVLSRPEPGLAICGFGMRDVSFDQDPPRPLQAYRDGAALMDFDDRSEGYVGKLNDQHAFLIIPPDSPLAVGDVITFGISHPCTCLDRWRLFFGLDEAGRVCSAYRTFFG